MPFIPVRDIQIYYEVQGNGPKLLAVSGSGGDLRHRPNVFDSPLAKHFEILAYDQRGLGQTDAPDQPYTMADYAEDAAALLAALGWQKCFVMGTSFGGMVAQEFTIRYPEMVSRLVLACTSTGGKGGASYPLHTIGNLNPTERAEHMIPLSDTRYDAAWQADNADEYKAMLEFAVELNKANARRPSERQMGARRQLEARIGHDVYDRLPQLTMPVYICGGRYDGIAPVSNLETIQQQLAHSELALFEGGHGFLQQDANAYQAVLKFLQGAKTNQDIARSNENS